MHFCFAFRFFCACLFSSCDSLKNPKEDWYNKKSEYSTYAEKLNAYLVDEYVLKISDTIPFYSIDDHKKEMFSGTWLESVEFVKTEFRDETLGINVYTSGCDNSVIVYDLQFVFKDKEFSGLYTNYSIRADDPYLNELLKRTGYENDLAGFKLDRDYFEALSESDYLLLINLLESIYSFMYDEYSAYMTNESSGS